MAFYQNDPVWMYLFGRKRKQPAIVDSVIETRRGTIRYILRSPKTNKIYKGRTFGPTELEARTVDVNPTGRAPLGWHL